MPYIKRIATILLLASPVLYSNTASSKSYIDERMTQKEIQAYLQRRMSDREEREIRSLTKHLIRLCHETGFSPETVLALIATESSFDPEAVSGRGAIGLMQLMPETARYIAHREHLYYHKPSDLKNPKINLTIGIHYLAHLRSRFDGAREYLAAYNMGPTKFRRMRQDAGPGYTPVAVRRYVHSIQVGAFGVKRDAREIIAER